MRDLFPVGAAVLCQQHVVHNRAIVGDGWHRSRASTQLAAQARDPAKFCAEFTGYARCQTAMLEFCLDRVAVSSIWRS